jgi:predicted nucleotidyltransferase
MLGWDNIMDLGRPLSVITPTVDGDVLAVLARAEVPFTGRQVHQIAGRHSERGIRNALHRLSAQGIVSRERVGSADQYRLNRAHLAAPYVEALARLRDELLRRLAGELQGWMIPAAFAALFGSAARGEMHAGSDIDLLVVRPDGVDADEPNWRAQLDAVALHVTAWTGNDTRVLEFSVREARAGLAASDGVLLAARDEGLVIHGPLTYLSDLGRRARRRG